jgi:hypothetical protein
MASKRSRILEQEPGLCLGMQIRHQIPGGGVLSADTTQQAMLYQLSDFSFDCGVIHGLFSLSRGGQPVENYACLS